jgi:hypothetical protein
MKRKARAVIKRRIMAMHNTGRGPVTFIIAEERAGETRCPTRAATWMRMKRIALNIVSSSLHTLVAKTDLEPSGATSVTILNKTAVRIEFPPSIRRVRELSQPAQIGIKGWEDSTTSHHTKPSDILRRARANTGFLPILFLVSRNPFNKRRATYLSAAIPHGNAATIPTIESIILKRPNVNATWPWIFGSLYISSSIGSEPAYW